MPGRHKKWQEVSLANKPYEWRRFSFAKQMLAQRRPVARRRVARGGSGDAKLLRDFRRFLKLRGQDGDLTEEQQLRLFKEFRDFMRKNNR